MKNLKRLLLKEKRILTKEGFNPEDYLRERKTANDIIFVNVNTGDKLLIRY